MARRRGSPARARFAPIAAIVFALGCSACASSVMISEDAPKSSDLERLVLLPMNFDSSPSPAIAAGVEVMGERLLSFLEASGYEVIAPRMSMTLALWKTCADEVGGISSRDGEGVDLERYNSARSELARRMLESTSADGVVAAAVVVREGRYTGKHLRWDGVKRLVPMDTEKTTRPVLFLRGTAAGTTLRTSVFDLEGRLIFERYVGLEPVNGYEVVGSRFRVTLRNDLFQDEALLQEGIALSFQPWLVRPLVP